MRLMIVGPMTNRHLFGFTAFDAAAEQLRAAGHEVINPAELSRAAGFDPERHVENTALRQAAIRRNLTALLSVEAVAVLPGWRSSRGALSEVETARSIGLPVVSAVNLDPVPEETIADEAVRLVTGPRQAAYSHPREDYAATGAIWGALLHDWAMHAAGSPDPIPVPPALACLLMVGVKLSRESRQQGRDNRVDAVGYLLCSDMCIDEDERRERSRWP